MARLNPEYLQQLAIKAVQDLAESSHYLYTSIKAVDFQCIPPHDNVLGGVSFSFLPRITQNGASFARVLILDNWMRKIEWYEYEYGQLVDETKELLPESLEKAWLEHTGIPVREPIDLDENDVNIGSVLVTEAVRKKLPRSEINGILYRHSKHDWGDVEESSWAMNDAAVKALKGTILSVYSFTDGTYCFVETNFTTGSTTVFMGYEA